MYKFISAGRYSQFEEKCQEAWDDGWKICNGQPSINGISYHIALEKDDIKVETNTTF